MGEHSVTLLAAEEGGGTSNFLIPNGTFFFVLAIFLIVLGVIAKFVVPPIQTVLGERERMIAQTAEDNRKATALEAAAEADYNKEIGVGRAEAANIRDEARSVGRAIIDDKRGVANDEVAPPRRWSDGPARSQRPSGLPPMHCCRRERLLTR